MEEMIIDGCNLAYKAYGASGDKEIAALIARLRDYYGRKTIAVTIVFDSSAGEDVSHILPHIKIYQSSSADEYIAQLVKRSRRPKTLIVVTDDRALANRVKALGANLIRSTDFLAHWKGWIRHESAPPDNEKPSSETPDDLERYLKLWE